MGGSEPILQLIFDYWESRPAALGARLDALLRNGVSHIATFVPWQAVESDISHSLSRFLVAAAERKMTVSLILTPEVGVDFAFSGMPKDIFSKTENLAKGIDESPVTASLPPNAFHLPSLMAPDVQKRYHGFLARIDALLADLSRSQPAVLKGVTAVLTGSYWKYYRTPQASAQDAFFGSCGDYGGAASMAFRQRLDQFFSTREFSEPGPQASARWKTRELEGVNRRWFMQQSEDVFRNRSSQFLRRKALSLRVSTVELYTPEADPGYAYSQFFQVFSGGGGDFSRLSRLLDQMSARASSAAPSVHWTGLSGFRSLSDSEKQFLILKSLLLMGGRGGGIFVDIDDWFALSAAFRRRTEVLAAQLSSGELRMPSEALYLAPHLWSGGGTLWDELSNKVGFGAQLIASADVALKDPDAGLMMVDPTVIVTRDVLAKLTHWARKGRLLLLPRGPLYTHSARMELEKSLAHSESMDIDLGITYSVFPYGSGKIVLYDVPEGLKMAGEALASWQKFLVSVLNLAGIQPSCSLSDGRLSAIALERRKGGKGVFVLNPTSRPVSGELFFPSEVSVFDLTAGEPEDLANLGEASARFALEVPPTGILPIAARDFGPTGRDAEERKEARLTAEVLREGAAHAAVSELAGLNEGPSAWN